MGELVSADIASLSKSLMADFTLEGLFARVSPLMGLYFLRKKKKAHVSFCLVRRNCMARGG